MRTSDKLSDCQASRLCPGESACQAAFDLRGRHEPALMTHYIAKDSNVGRHADEAWRAASISRGGLRSLCSSYSRCSSLVGGKAKRAHHALQFRVIFRSQPLVVVPSASHDASPARDSNCGLVKYPRIMADTWIAPISWPSPFRLSTAAYRTVIGHHRTSASDLVHIAVTIRKRRVDVVNLWIVSG